jgi:hypothetical protein
MKNSLSRLIQLVPNGVFGSQKELININAPYIALITGCDGDIHPAEDFKLGGKVQWCEHRQEAAKNHKTIDPFELIGEHECFKLAFFAEQQDPNADPLDLIYASKLVVRGYQKFDDNLIKMVVLRNVLTYNNLSEHLIYMDTADI